MYSLIQKKSISRKRKSKTSWADLKTIKVLYIHDS